MSISTLVSILQDSTGDWKKEFTTEKYFIRIYNLPGSRELRCVETGTENLFNLYINSTDNIIRQVYSVRTFLSSTHEVSWYELNSPAKEKNIVPFNKCYDYDYEQLFLLNVQSEEDAFQKSTISTVDIDAITSLIHESTQSEKYLSDNEILYFTIQGYDSFDFNEIIKVLKG